MSQDTQDYADPGYARRHALAGDKERLASLRVRIANARLRGEDTWASVLEVDVAEIIGRRLLKRWPYDKPYSDQER